jgi:hypothetical protein
VDLDRQEVGLAERSLTASHNTDRRLMTSFN